MKKFLKLFICFVLLTCTIPNVNAVTLNTEASPYEMEYVVLNRDGWVATADSYQNASGDSDGPASNLLDGNLNSFWHTAYNNSGVTSDQDYPHNVVIKFSEDCSKEETFSSFEYTTRQGSETNGNIAGYKFYISNSVTSLGFGDEEWELVKEGTFTSTGAIKVDLGDSYTATQVRLEALSSQNGQRYAGGAEFNLLVKGNKRAAISSSNMSIEVSGTTETGPTNNSNINHVKQVLFDGLNTTYWQSQSVEKGTLENNAWLKINLNKPYFIDRIDLSKRYDSGAKWGCTGNMNNAIIEVSEDGDNWIKVFEGNIPDETTTDGIARIVFDQTLVKYIRISSNSTYHWEYGQAGHSDKRDTILGLADIKVYGFEQTSVNLARTAGVKFSVHNPDGTPGSYDKNNRPLTKLNDNTINKDQYVDIHGNSANPERAYLQTDLGGLCYIENIKMYRYTGNTYLNTVILVSDDVNFTNPTIVFNADSGNIFGFGEGEDIQQAETDAGIEYNANLPVLGRYIRVYSSGKQGSNDNHINEFQVFGTQFNSIDVNYGDYLGTDSSYIRESNYEDETGSNLVASSVANSYTKYVSGKVLTVKYQTDTVGDKINARFVSTVPSLNLEKVKFTLEITGGGKTSTVEKEISKVYETINADSITYTNAGEVFGNNASKYFFAVKLNGIPTNTDRIIKVTPSWLPYGETEYVNGTPTEYQVVDGELVIK